MMVSGCWCSLCLRRTRLLGRFLEMMIVWQNFAEEVNLQGLSCWLLLRQSSVADSSVDDTVLCQCLLHCQPEQPVLDNV